MVNGLYLSSTFLVELTLQSTLTRQAPLTHSHTLSYRTPYFIVLEATLWFLSQSHTLMDTAEVTWGSVSCPGTLQRVIRAPLWGSRESNSRLSDWQTTAHPPEQQPLWPGACKDHLWSYFYTLEQPEDMCMCHRECTKALNSCPEFTDYQFTSLPVNETGHNEF